MKSLFKYVTHCWVDPHCYTNRQQGPLNQMRKRANIFITLKTHFSNKSLRGSRSFLDIKIMHTNDRS